MPFKTVSNILAWICLCLATIAASAQTQPPLSLDQVKKLIVINAPDAAVAREIQQRGLAFTPTRGTLAQLQSAGAGSNTLAAIRALMPMLDDAKREIPRILQALYPALDQGNPGGARMSMSPELWANSSKLDRICKPFTYRAHYVEAIIERPQRRFEARVHVLFKPLEERAYILWFGLSGDSFQLLDVTDPDNEWFQSRITEAEQMVRKFVYAVNAGRSDVAQQCVAPALARYLNSSPVLQQIAGSPIAAVSPNENTRMEYYKGQKIRANFRVQREQGFPEVYTFLLDRIDDQEKIVAWSQGEGREGYNPEDPGLEYATLTRFGISAPPPSPVETASVQQTAAAKPVSSVPATPKPKTFAFRHQHINLFGQGNAVVYCWGFLVVEGNGTIRYDCTGTNDPQGRCDHVVFPPGTLDEAKVRMDGGLHLAGKGLGKYDFYGSGVAGREALAAVAPLVKH